MALTYNTVAGAPTNPAASPINFFGAKSTSNTSSTFVVNKEPYYIEVYNLANGDTVTLQQVTGTGSGATFQNFAPLGVPYQLTPAQSKVRLDWPGYYRLVFSGASVNAITCVGFPATMTHDSVFGISPLNGGPGGNSAVQGTAPITVTGNGAAGNPYIVGINQANLVHFNASSALSISGDGSSGAPFNLSIPGQSDLATVSPSGTKNINIGSTAGNSVSGNALTANAGNVFIGVQSGVSSSGRANICVGSQTGESITASQCVLVGNAAGSGSTFTDNTVAIGYSAASSASGSGVFIGSGAGSSNSNNGVIIIDESASGLTATADHYCMLGSAAITHTVTAGSIIAGGAISASDLRLKTHIQPLGSVAAKLASLRPVSFAWDEERLVDAGLPHLKSDMSKQHTGVIAQELQKVFPEAIEPVSGTDGEQYLFVHYDRLIPTMIAVINELSSRLIVLENRNAS